MKYFLGTVFALLLALASPMLLSATADDADHSRLDDILKTASGNADIVKQLEPLMSGSFAEDAEAQFYYGRSLFALQQYSKAKVAYDKALALDLYDSWAVEVNRDLAIINSGPTVVHSSPTHGGFRGYIGVILDKNVVYSVLPHSPAEAAHLLPGDIILAVNNISVLTLPEREISAKIGGVAGGAVDLTIMRAGKKYSSKIVRAVNNGKPGEDPVFDGAQNVSQDRKPAPVASKAHVAYSAGDDALIKVFRHTSDTDAIKGKVLEALAHIPKHVKDDLAVAGVVILIVPTVLDARPDFASQKPRGYDNGGGYDNVGGMYIPSEKTVFIAEKHGVWNQPYRVNRSVYETVLHECGHAFDYTADKLSKKDDFQAVYKKECDAVSNTNRKHVTYFLQQDGAGGEELFAELFVSVCDPEFKERFDITKIFPATLALEKKMIQ